ncbi:MAG: thioredoxin domain-containing protein [Candidatus Taylorbacteria bacterium]|nr:thioredoxin domain-containing protein [Candidatus Taylorbacteria bacterium]
MDNSPRSNFITLPGAIIIAGALIAVALIYIKYPEKPKNAQTVLNTPQIEQVKMKAVTTMDHILGNPDAPIKIVEYSDTSCPYCRIFNATMEQIMAEYGHTGKVAWIYRNWPLDKPDQEGRILHKNAGHEAQALECVASIGGNEKFWAYEKLLYETTPSVTGTTPNGLDQAELPIMAKAVGIDQRAFTDCLSSGKFQEKVEADFMDGVNAGVTGTPYSIIVTPSGNNIPITGAQPYSTVKMAIDSLLR